MPYKSFPGFADLVQASTFTSTLRSFTVEINGRIHDDDWGDPDDEIPYSATITDELIPGGLPINRTGSAVCDDEVEIRWIIGFFMDMAEQLFISGTLQLLEGSRGGRDLVVEERFGPIATDRGAPRREALNTTLRDDEDDFASFIMHVTNA